MVPSFNFFLGAVLEIQRSKFFSVFPTWLPHHVTHDVIIMIKAFYMSCCSDVRTNKQTNKQTDKQMKNHSKSGNLAKQHKTTQTVEWHSVKRIPLPGETVCFVFH